MALTRVDTQILELTQETVVGSARGDGLLSNGWVTQTNHQATTAELADISDPVNTPNKHVGKWGFNTTTSRYVYSVGAATNLVWNFPDGTLAHTPA